MGPDAPRVVTPRIDAGVPVFALGGYAGARRHVIVAMKDRGRSDLAAPLAHVLALGLHRLLDWGLLDVPLTIVPATSSPGRSLIDVTFCSRSPGPRRPRRPTRYSPSYRTW